MMPEYSINSIEILSNSDRQDTGEENSDEENFDKKN